MNIPGNEPGNGLPKERKNIKGQRLSRHLKIDMTPMVDLGFLLIAFFVMTAELTKPTVMKLSMPKEGPPMDLAESDALTVLLSGEHGWFYEGSWEKAKKANKVMELKYADNGLRKAIIQKQKNMDAGRITSLERNQLMLLIKATETASYKDVVDALDEATICDVKKYALVKTSASEEEWMKNTASEN